MARYTGPSCKLCRREGTKLYLKGERCLSDKCAFNRRTSAPGQHGAAKKKLTEYGMQLREKQKAKRYYGVLEKQFKNYYDIADNQEGIAGENLLRLLERRLDNVVYRMGLASSHKEARQLVLHGHFTVNGKNANIPSILVKPGDVIAAKETDSVKIKELIENMGDRIAPKWLDIDKNGSAKVVAMPERDDIDFEFNEQLIIELYSK
ncbi:MAG: 30S ribosomal protein S4 [Clostridia bacterium]|nr:30S ribosomal protein S4 [Clostridia bacterium]MBQ8764957.1 30S ribosomal protein S4 [Clostridia bacterium]MBQ9745025.1 30S ribosomal protein S4 [Clostridia bacterium]